MEVNIQAIDARYTIDYEYSEINHRLAPLTDKCFFDSQEIWKNSSFTNLNLSIIIIAKKLLLHFADKESVYIHKGDELPHSLYLQPKNALAFILNKHLENKSFSGTYKTGHPILCITSKGIKQVVKLSNKLPKTIKAREIEAALRYRNLPGFVPIFGYFSHTAEMKTNDNNTNSCDQSSAVVSDNKLSKQTFLLEKFSNNIENLYRQRCTSNELWVLLHDTALAIQKLHSDGYIHGDIAPPNILYAKNEDEIIYKAALWDFGFIRKAYSAPPEMEKFREKPWIIHNARKICYTPESLKHLYDNDLAWVTLEHDRKANDVYAFGISLYYLVFKKIPEWYQKLKKLDIFKPLEFDRETCSTIIREQEEICTKINFFMLLRNKSALEELQLLVLKMLHPTMKERPTIDQVVEELNRISGLL